MSYDVVIEIMGEATDADALRNVAEALEEDASEWPVCHGADFDDIVGQMKKAAATGDMLVLYKTDSRGLFQSARSACQEAGLSYVVSFGPTGGGTIYDEAIFCRDGGEEFQIPLDAGNEVIPLRDVRKAALVGVEAVQAVIDEYDRKVLKDVPRTFTVSSEVLETLEASGPSYA
ncbi:hypothetical protein G6L37_02595 [Agrobacterium rubi]|nr:hypothetical protein [Agrobacterium rubi]NTF24285.1 hypothetical protein [Agrobacterium rubi]